MNHTRTTTTCTATTTDPAAAAVALWMAARLGWRVLPLHPGTKKPLGGCDRCREDSHAAGDCPCLARGDGALCHGVWAASNDPAVVGRWARRWPGGVWGLNLGASGLLAVDLDTRGGTAPAQPLNGLTWPQSEPRPVDGLDTFATLASLHGAGIDTDATLTTETPSGGLHLIYTAESGRWKSTNAQVRDDRVCSGIGWQVDLKSHAGYVVIPGSTTPAGRYRRSSATTTPAPLPVWLNRFLAATGHDRTTPTAIPHTRPTAPAAPVVDGSREVRFASGALRSACAELAEMEPRSGRNRKLFRSASRLAGMAQAGWIDPTHVETELTAAAVAAGLPASEIRYAIASGFRTPHPATLRSAA